MQATSSFRLCEKREVYVILYSWSEQSLTKDKFHLFLVAYILFQYGGILALHNLLSVFMNYCLVINTCMLKYNFKHIYIMRLAESLAIYIR